MAQLCLTPNSFALWMNSWGRTRISKKQTQAGLGGGLRAQLPGRRLCCPLLVSVCTDVHLSVQSRVAEGPQGSWVGV